MTTTWHHGAWNRNFGDWVLHDAVQHHLSGAAAVPMRFVSVDSQRTTYGRDLIGKLNAEADLLVVGGGGLIFHRPEDESRSGWQWNIGLDDLDRIEVPFVVNAIGYNRFPHDERPWPAVLDAHLLRVQQRAELFSVRNSGTRRELVRRGLDPERIAVVPDAGLFAPCHAVDLGPAVAEAPLVIGVNVAGDRPEHRHPAPSERNELVCVEALAIALRQVLDERGGLVLMLPHVVDLDERFDALMRFHLGARRVVSLRHAAPHVFPPSSATASLLVGAYDRCDAVVGMRGHACLIAAGRGKPFLAWGSHAKNAFLIEDLGDVGLAAPFTAEDLVGGTVAPEAAAEALRRCLDDATLSGRIDAAVASLRPTFDAWNRRVAALALDRCAVA
jgi:polysaccharide pyruvyl transferase WcaK-like protein